MDNYTVGSGKCQPDPYLTTQGKFHALTSHLWRAPGETWVYLWATGVGKGNAEKLTRWFRNGADIVVPHEWAGGHNYFSVNPSIKRHGEKQRATIDDIAAINCVYADFDAKDFAASKEAFLLDQAPYRQIALDHILGLPIRPSSTIFTGGGYQCYWLLAETFVIATDDDRERAKTMQADWVPFVGGDEGAKDPVRVLRTPGTKNTKPIYGPDYPTVDFAWFEPERLYTFQELRAACPVGNLDAPKAPGRAKPTSVGTNATHAEKTQSRDNGGLSPFVLRVLMAYNADHEIGATLEQRGYVQRTRTRYTHPHQTSKETSVQVNHAKNGSYHHSSADPLHGDHLRKPFDVVALLDYSGNYDAAASALAPAYGLFSPESVTATIGRFRRLSLSADWSKIVPVDRQGKNGYRTGETDRLLFDNLLDIMASVGRFTNVAISERALSRVVNSRDQVVTTVAKRTVTNFLNRVNGVLIDYRVEDRKTIISLVEPVVGKVATSSYLEGLYEVATLPTTTQFNVRKGDDAFAKGATREVRQAIRSDMRELMASNPDYADAHRAYKSALKAKPETTGELRALMGDDHYTLYRQLLKVAGDQFLPTLGSYGLLILDYVRQHPHCTRQEIMAGTGITANALRSKLPKLEEWGALDATQEGRATAKTYFCAETVFADLDERLPESRTDGIGLERHAKALEIAHKWADKQASEAHESGDYPRRNLAQRQAIRIAAQRVATLGAIYPDWSEDDIFLYVYAPVEAMHDHTEHRAPGRVNGRQITPVGAHTGPNRPLAHERATPVDADDLFDGRYLLADDAALVATVARQNGIGVRFTRHDLNN